MASSTKDGGTDDVLQAYLAARFAQLQKEIAHRAAVGSREPHLSGGSLSAFGTIQMGAFGTCHTAWTAHRVDGALYAGADIEAWSTQATRCRARPWHAHPAPPREKPCNMTIGKLKGLCLSAATKSLSDLSMASTNHPLFSEDASSDVSIAGDSDA